MNLVRLDKFLANSGVGSRSQVKNYIKFRRVWVDGSPVLNSDFKIDPKKNVVTFDKRVVSFEKFCYLMLNKPKNVVCSTCDPCSKTVIDLLPSDYSHFNLFPVGRLDKDTVGLVILSNDGSFAHNTLSPKKHIKKSYLAHINGEISDFHICQFKKGVTIDGGYTCLPANLEILYSSTNFSKVKVTINEGKFHQIKRMFNVFDKKVIFLQRLSFGDIFLDTSLAEGDFRHLNDLEMSSIKKYLS